MIKARKYLGCYWAVFLLSLITVIDIAGATQPRITPGLLSPDRFEIFIYEYPPLASLDIPSGGLYPEIIQAALNKENIDPTITILPIKSLVKFNLLQDNALGIVGEGWGFSEAEIKNLIFMPFIIIKDGYYYYSPVQSRELSMDNGLAGLKELTYGAQKGENVTSFEEAGIAVSFGNIRSNYKKLKNNKIDFLKVTELTNEWMVSRLYAGEEKNFLLIDGSSREIITPIIFNRNNSEAEDIARKFRKGLEMIKQDGTYLSILEKYYGKGKIPKDYFLRLESHQGKEE